MKSLLDYFIESREDGKYLDLPQSMSKPYFYPGIPKDYKESAKKRWKEYKESVIKINGENLDILIDKLKEAIESKKGNNNFILNAQTCKFDSFYGNNSDKDIDFFDTVEAAAKEARIALETEDINASSFLKSRQPEKVKEYDKDQTLFWWNSKGFTFSIYHALSTIAQAYNVDIPKFNDDLNLLSTDSVYSKYEKIWNSRSHSSNDAKREEQSHKAYDRAEKEYEKDAAALKKAREKFKKTETYKNIIDILDKVENDLTMAESKYQSWANVIAAKIKKDEEAKRLADAIEQTKDTVNDALKSSFGSSGRISWGVDNLYKMAGQAYIESDNQQPEIKELSRNTGSWLSGMHTTCEFEVIGANGKSYGKVKLQDKGLDGDDGRPVDGFGAWD